MAGQTSRDRTVYVIELNRAVLTRKSFAEANPQYRPGEPCVYVGMTVLTPQARFRQHKSGERANRYVRKFGLRLLQEECVSDLTYQEAQEKEVGLATTLRLRGWAAWQK